MLGAVEILCHVAAAAGAITGAAVGAITGAAVGAITGGVVMVAGAAANVVGCSVQQFLKSHGGPPGREELIFGLFDRNLGPPLYRVPRVPGPPVYCLFKRRGDSVTGLRMLRS
ncbi:hypothetical protein NQZ68_031271 [Dissostichus eleginoides]|nr:hypothetical protein NQZ68_031271 [Dissostichus eleginoides]